VTWEASVNSPGKRWSEDETKLALYLYFQLPFGQLHSGNPEIQKLAGTLGRTNSSVAMKLCNFASLDPKITSSGRKGLQGASAQDRKVWAQFNDDWTGQVEDVERVWNVSNEEEGDEPLRLRDNATPFAFEPYDGPSVTEATIRRRVGQGFFRRSVLANFDNRCCITGIAEPILLNASHIIPWGIDMKNRHNPANGLCLSATFDRAFDRGLITLDHTQRVCISKILLEHDSPKTRDYFLQFHGSAILKAHRFDPDENFLVWHRSFRFKDESSG
jgi:putative restriction endonuclease